MIEQAFRIGSFANIPVRIHWTFLLLIVYIIGSGLYDKSSWSGILFLIGFTLCMFFCVVLHEFGHALTAKKFGIRTADIILLPIGGVARLQNLPDKPRQELWIAIMGPVVNLLIAIILFVVLYAIHGNAMIHLFSGEIPLNMNVSEFMSLLLQANLLLMIFNLIPAFPMDGGRVLRAFIAIYSNRLVATRWASRIGQALCILFIIYGFYSEAWTLIFIGIFIFLGASQEYSMVKQEFLYKDKFIKDFYYKIQHYFPEYALIKDIRDEFRMLGQKHIPVLDIEGRISGIISLPFIQLNYEKVKNLQIKEIMFAQLISLPQSSTLLDTVKYFDSGIPAVFVTDGFQIIGMLDADCIKINLSQSVS
ncbi:MAG: site-2 protease family protein [Saprospiraceae bacterium]|nr:site-2 protease family protein [Saprospiraceae bacterium]